MSTLPPPVPDDLTGAAIARFLADHLAQMHATSPPDSIHALDLDALRAPGVRFFTVYDGDEPLACGALKRLDAGHVELKSMRTAPHRRREGLATHLLTHLLAEARAGGFARISLETGSAPFFAPAHALYARHGFVPCEPFAQYRPDPHSVFLTRTL